MRLQGVLKAHQGRWVGGVVELVPLSVIRSLLIRRSCALLPSSQ